MPVALDPAIRSAVQFDRRYSCRCDEAIFGPRAMTNGDATVPQVALALLAGGADAFARGSDAASTASKNARHAARFQAGGSE